MTDDYAERIKAEISTFEKALAVGGVTSSIPSAFTWWASKYLSPRLDSVFGERDISKIFATEIFRTASTKGKFNLRILSLGSGDCQFEEQVDTILREGAVRAQWICTDLNPAIGAHALKRISDANTSAQFEVQALDLNKEFPSGTFDVVMANHSLHHFVELEFIFEQTRRAIGLDGRFIVSDMIGRNGHMRWPEALPFVEMFWRSLPDAYRLNNHAKCVEGESFVNYDCTIGGDFEGIRAQDILPLMLYNFSFEKFVAFGGLTDIFIDRSYGDNFSMDREFDQRFIRLVHEMNMHLIDIGLVKPTMLVATAGAGELQCDFDRWSPRHSVRNVD